MVARALTICKKYCGAVVVFFLERGQTLVLVRVTTENGGAVAIELAVSEQGTWDVRKTFVCAVHNEGPRIHRNIP